MRKSSSRAYITGHQRTELVLCGACEFFLATHSVMLFCPNCANVVTVLPSSSTGENKWTCPTCPFEFPMDRQVTSRIRLERKQVDDVMGGEDSWKNVDSTDGTCAARARHSLPCSNVPQVRPWACLLYAATDPVGGRAKYVGAVLTSSDDVLQMHQARVRIPVARKLAAPRHCTIARIGYDAQAVLRVPHRRRRARLDAPPRSRRWRRLHIV